MVPPVHRKRLDNFTNPAEPGQCPSALLTIIVLSFFAMSNYTTDPYALIFISKISKAGSAGHSPAYFVQIRFRPGTFGRDSKQFLVNIFHTPHEQVDEKILDIGMPSDHFPERFLLQK